MPWFSRRLTHCCTLPGRAVKSSVSLGQSRAQRRIPAKDNRRLHKTNCLPEGLFHLTASLNPKEKVAE